MQDIGINGLYKPMDKKPKNQIPIESLKLNYPERLKKELENRNLELKKTINIKGK